MYKVRIKGSHPKTRCPFAGVSQDSNGQATRTPMTFWNSLSEGAKNNLTGAAIILPAVILAGIVGVATDWNLYDAIRWLLQ